MAEAKEKPAPVAKTDEAPTGGKTHIRFVGHPDHAEDPSTTVFGKLFHRYKWVPLANLDGSNPDKKAVTPEQLKKLLGNPAFEVGDGTDASKPGSEDVTEQAEEA